jgi:antirestriction protein
MNPNTETTNTPEGQNMTETKSSTGPRIYVACLSAYNAGKLHGAWIDVDGKDADALQEEITRRVLLTSPEPNVKRCKLCLTVKTHFAPVPECTHVNEALRTDHEWGPSSEEYAIHDHDGFGKIRISEYANIDTVATVAALLNDHDSAVLEYAYGCVSGWDQVADYIEEHYRGAWNSLQDYAENYLDDTGAFEGLPEDHIARQYFDYEAFARDLELGGDVSTVEGEDGKTHIFDNY